MGRPVRPMDAGREVEAEVMISLMVQRGTETHVAGGIELIVSGDPWGLVGKEGASLFWQTQGRGGHTHG